MSVPDRVVAGILLLFLAATPLFASSQLEADPHELYEAARNHLKNGDLQAADSALVQLRGLVAPGSRWDPDGVFAKELLPPLWAKLRRMQAAAQELDAFCANALEDLKMPGKERDGSTVHDYTHWAASQIENLRAERDRILSAKLASPEERAAMTRTTSYACVERLLETDVLKSLPDIPDAAPSSVVSPDPQADPIQVRFRQLKQDLMKTIAERDRLRQEVKQAEGREAAFLAALADIMTRGALPAPTSNGPGAKAASDDFGSFLDAELKSVSRQHSQTSAELEARRVDLDRYRRYNALIVQAGLGTDQKARIKELEEAVEALHVHDELQPRPSRAPWRTGPVAAVLGFLIGASTSWAVMRGRRRFSPRAMGTPVPIHGTRARRSSGDGHAA